MGTSDPFTFRFLKISKPNTSMFWKIMALNLWKDTYRKNMGKKIPLKILYILGNTKKTNF
jgi:hypothetical protein